MVVASDTDILDNPPRNQYTASSNQTKFDYTFVIFDEDDIVVKKTQNPGTTNETTTTLTRGGSNDYTVSGVGNENGGTITLNSGATQGDRYTIFRDIPRERTTDFLQSGPYLGEDINTELDVITMILQEIENQFKRTLKLNDITTIDSIELPSPSAGQFLQWNDNEDGFDNASAVSSDSSSYNATVDLTADTFKTINHNLKEKYVNVSIYDKDDNEIGVDKVELIDEDSLKLRANRDLTDVTIVAGV